MLPPVPAKLDIQKETTGFSSLYLEDYIGRQKYSNFYLIVNHLENLIRTEGYFHFTREAHSYMQLNCPRKTDNLKGTQVHEGIAFDL